MGKSHFISVYGLLNQIENIYLSLLELKLILETSLGEMCCIDVESTLTTALENPFLQN